MRAMPSPTSSPRPTSSVWTCERYCSISVCRTETISSALNLITASFDELFLQVFQFGSQRAVVAPVVDADDHAAQQRGIDLGLQHRLTLKRLPELIGEALTLIV